MKTSTKTKKATDNTKANDKLLALVRLEPPKTKEGLMELCATATRLTLERDAAQLKMDRRILDLKEAQAPAIDAMNSQIAQSVKLMHLWALENREAEFDGKQGIEVMGCTLEFRKGTGKVVPDVDEETTVDRLLALPETYAEEQRSLVRLRCDLNKQAVIAMARTDDGEAFLKKMGLQIVVQEEFKFTPAREDLTPLPVSGGKSTLKEPAAAYAAA
jgi:hypothetical protein